MMRRDAAIVNEMEFRMSSASKGLSPRSHSAMVKRFLLQSSASADHCILDEHLATQRPMSAMQLDATVNSLLARALIQSTIPCGPPIRNQMT
ncbi:hypothetical protein FFI89_032390 [Bradyrhizobium sp. KBS0727]|jgi:hypothetical protein|uniref:hypothetical protein n=1 Tax=unclassified Bradyrhizobium TaxID=2631580 RepID=UPI00110DD229|nr:MULTISPECIES: hypothetical protein [unclassified Bradyrhizobium]QDW41409.1 hypothetical protein FFI71_032395 [Bradyrhizobium sp. KBS0725]QDW48015.1 hypothetical protein FFI89_032390 [Bradyrhizobium sp. KBS0727]